MSFSRKGINLFNRRVEKWHQKTKWKLFLSFKQRLASILAKELLLATVMKDIQEMETFVLISMNVPKLRVRRMLLVKIPSGRFYVHVILATLEMD